MASNVRISKLVPDEVEQDWKDTIKVEGEYFEKGDYVIVDGDFPVRRFVSSTEMEVDVDERHTCTPGDKPVKIHTAGGDLSNTVMLTVTSPKAS